jgi:hypothetical protein
MATDLQKLPPLPQMADAIDLGERYMFLDCVQNLADRGVSQLGSMLEIASSLSEGPPSSPIRDLSGLNNLTVQFDAVAQVGMPWYDRLVIALRKPTWIERMAAWKKHQADYERFVGDIGSTMLAVLTQGPTGNTSEPIGKIVLIMTKPAARDAAESEMRTAQHFELTRAGFLLAAYRADNGRYPMQLSELAPKYLAQVPADLFTGGPLAYRPQPNGYLLYGFGPNGLDDGGLRHEDRTEGVNEVSDDLVVQIPIKPEYRLGR